jgi:hypothetical protein
MDAGSLAIVATIVTRKGRFSMRRKLHLYLSLVERAESDFA